jgi:hypothetical protein
LYDNFFNFYRCSEKFGIINEIVWASLETDGKSWKQIFKVGLQASYSKRLPNAILKAYILIYCTVLDIDRIPYQEWFGEIHRGLP